MNDGVKILLARMETHPEEFMDNLWHGQTKWGGLLNTFRHCLTKEEINAIDEGVRDIERGRFTELVMKELLDPQEDVQGELSLDPYKTQILPSSITYTSEPLVNIKPTTVKVRKPTTLGKLFNYT
jgi:hypothetical protein